MEKKKGKSKVGRVFKIIGNVLFYTIVGSFILVALLNGVDRYTGYNVPFFGLHSAVIVSDSMHEKNPNNTYLTEDMVRYDKYDLITFQEVKYEDIKVYDVVAYYYDDVLVCHRVIEKYQDTDDSGVTKNYLITQGDSNNTPDTPFESSLVKGKVIWKIPGIGFIFAFTSSLYFWIGLFIALFFLFLGIYIFKYGRPKKKELAYVDEVKESKNPAKSRDYEKQASRSNTIYVGGTPNYKSETSNLLAKEDVCKIDKRNYKLNTYYTQNDSGQASSVMLQVYEEEHENK